MLIAKLFRHCDRIFNRIQTLQAATHQGIWLGVLDRDSLHEITNVKYASDKMYQATSHTCAGLWNWEREVWDRHFLNCQSVVIAAAGGGREVLALCELGVDVDGFDCCESLIAYGNGILASQGFTTRLELSQPDKFPDHSKTYDGAIVGWGGYTHMMGRDTRVCFLKQLHRHLQPGSPLLVSFRLRTGPRRDLRVIQQLAQTIRCLRGSPQRIELGDTLIDGFTHLFTQEEVSEELGTAGYRVALFGDHGLGFAVAIAE